MFSNHLNWPYDTPRSLRLGGRLFQTCGGKGPVSKTAARPTGNEGSSISNMSWHLNHCSFWLQSISVITLNDSISNYRRGLVHSCRLLTSTGRSVWSLHWPAEWPETPVQCRPVRPPMISEETALPRICWAHIAPVNHITAHCQSQFNVISTSSV